MLVAPHVSAFIRALTGFPSESTAWAYAPTVCPVGHAQWPARCAPVAQANPCLPPRLALSAHGRPYRLDIGFERMSRFRLQSDQPRTRLLSASNGRTISTWRISRSAPVVHVCVHHTGSSVTYFYHKSRSPSAKIVRMPPPATPHIPSRSDPLVQVSSSGRLGHHGRGYRHTRISSVCARAPTSVRTERAEAPGVRDCCWF